MSRPRSLAITLSLSALTLLGPGPAGATERVVEVVEALRVEPSPPLRPLPHWTAPGRPTLALALSGGGGRGLAHLGVLAALAEEGVEVDALVGTSAGALVGGLAAAGYAPEEIKDLIARGELGALLAGLSDRPGAASRGDDLARSGAQVRLRRRRGGGAADSSRPSGLMAARDLDRELLRLLLLAQTASDGDFDRLSPRFRPVATDLVSGAKLAPSSGQLAPLITGSATIPGLMAPVAYEGALLVDGGLRENVPVETARELGLDVVIAVDVSQRVEPEAEPRNPLDVLDRSLDIVMDSKTQQSLRSADAVLRPDVSSVSRSEALALLDDLVEEGRSAVLDRRSHLFEVLRDLAPDRRMLDVDRLEVVGSTEALASAARLRDRLGLDDGRPVPRWLVASELALLLNRHAVASARAELVDRDGERVLRVVLEDRPLPRRLRMVGLAAPAEPDPLVEATWPAVRAAAWPLRRESLRSGDAFAHLASAELGGADSGDADADEVLLHWSRSEIVSLAAESGDRKLEQVSRRIGKLTGERFDYDRLASRLDELGSRGLVRRWRLRSEPDEREGVHLVAELEPDRPDELGLGGSYRGGLRWAGLLRLTRANLRGRGEALHLSVAGGEDETRAELAWESPFGFGLRTTGWELGAGWRSGSVPIVEASQSYGDLDAFSFEARRTWVGLVHRAGRRHLRSGLLHEHRKLDTEGSVLAHEHERTALYLRYVFDGQDRLLLPNSGGRLDVLGDAAVAGDELWRLELKGRWAVPLDDRATTVLLPRAAAGLSGHSGHRSFWFDPGGHAALYGWVPHGARAANHLGAGLALRQRLRAGRAYELHVELGTNWLRTAEDRDDLDEAEDRMGWGLSFTASLAWLGPVTLGWSGNDDGGDVYWLTAGFQFMDR